MPGHSQAWDKLSDPRGTVKSAMCMKPWTSLVAIGAGYMGGKFGAGIPGAFIGGAMTAATVSALVEFSPAAIGGNWEDPWDAKVAGITSLAIVGGVSGLAGAVIPVG